MFKSMNKYNPGKILLIFAVSAAFIGFIGCGEQENLSEESIGAEMKADTEAKSAGQAKDNYAEIDNAEATDTSNNTAFYKQRIDEFNREYGTKFVLPSGDKEAMEWITSLSPQAFEDFLTALYDESAYDIEQPRVRNNDILMEPFYGEIENTDAPESAEKAY